MVWFESNELRRCLNRIELESASLRERAREREQRETHETEIPRSDLHADDKDAREGKEGGVLADELECRLFGSDEVREEAGVGGRSLQTELVELRSDRGVREGAQDGAAVEGELCVGEEISEMSMGEEYAREESTHPHPHLFERQNSLFKEVVDFLTAPVHRINVHSTSKRMRVLIDGISRCSGIRIALGPVDMRRIEDEVERNGLGPGNGEGSTGEEGVEKGGSCAKETEGGEGR
jgi:hypothetical protein